MKTKCLDFTFLQGMLFNSFEYTWFLPLVFALYWAIPQKRVQAQNALLLIASYVFYGWWDYRFLSLIAASTLVDFLVAQQISKTAFKRARKGWLALSLAANLGVLGYFKYANFFIQSAVEAIQLIGFEAHVATLQIILPVGISFYTFQTLSYTIDVYRGNLKPTSNLLTFATYVSFFPQLVAGPIERASTLLPQLTNHRKFSKDQAWLGIQRIIWGLVKKVVLADQLAPIVNNTFAQYDTAGSMELAIGAIYFAFQIYGDFSGYSDVAIGTAQLFGIRLMENFKFPYLAQNSSDFWHRWHISLSTWFRDYVYIPLGGSKQGRWVSLRNIFIIFIVSGFWHGANFTFIFWGAIHALLYVPLFLKGTNRKHLDQQDTNGFKMAINVLTTFGLITAAWVFFRAESVTEAFGYFQHLFEFKGNLYLPKWWWLPIILIAVELWLQKQQLLAPKFSNNYLNGLLYVVLLHVLLIYSKGDSSSFIYFQF